MKSQAAMSKDEYLEWIKTRGECGTWSHDDCRRADQLIKNTALDNFKRKAEKWGMSKEAFDYFVQSVDIHFGAVETDDLLMSLGCYPEWMEPNK